MPITETRKAKRNRYRIEDGKWCIDIKLKSAQQLFDGRDPAPFRERDLDEKAASYLIGSVQEIPRKEPIKIVLSVDERLSPPLPSDVLAEAIHGHFEYELEQTERLARQQIGRAQVFLAIGLSVLIIFLSLAELTMRLPESTMQRILHEGLYITGWVAMWRPLEALLYDWWPHVDQRRLIRRILGAELVVRYSEIAESANP